MSRHRRPPTRRAFTLIEVLVTVASLVIVLGLMASLARSVRREASAKQTRTLLVTLTTLMDRYVARHDQLPNVSPFLARPNGSADQAITDALPDEQQLRAAARTNNREVVAALRPEAGPTTDLFAPVAGPAPGDDRVPDAWGRDIVFMSRGHPAIGTALQDRPFFFSAGPDGRYQTLEDNVYSYEIASTDDSDRRFDPVTPAPAGVPGGGHRE